MALNIPFSILPPPLVIRLAKPLKGLGNFIATLFPGMRLELIQAGMEVTPREYAGMALIVGISNAIAIFALLYGIGIAVDKDLLALGIAGALVVGAASFITVISYPRVIATKKTRSLEDQLIPALRQLLIDLRSGVPLFQAMASVSTGYGEVSAEFRKMVKEMNAGMSQPDVLNEASRRVASFRFRRVLWQINNALRVGSDVAAALDAMVDELTRERVDDIRRYGQELNPWVMIYMIAAVVIPSLGITMLIVVLSFLNIPVPKIVFPVIWFFLAGFQIFFISFVKSRRPAVEG